MAGKKTSPKSPSALRKPAHGNGMLQTGNPGNKGNPNAPGRPRSAIRASARSSFDSRIAILEKIADEEEGKASDKVGSLRLLAQVGGLDKEPVINQELIRELAKAVEAELPDIEGVPMGPVTERIYERWAVTLGRYAAGDA